MNKRSNGTILVLFVSLMYLTTVLFRGVSILILILVFLSANGQIEPGNPDKATIYIYRAQFWGSAGKYPCFVNDTYVGHIPQMKYLKLEIDPGHHLLWVKAAKFGFLKSVFEAGNVYVLNAIQYQPGAFKNKHVMLRPVNPDETKKLKVLYRMIANDYRHVTSEKKLLKFQKKFQDIIAQSEHNFQEWLDTDEWESIAELPIHSNER